MTNQTPQSAYVTRSITYHFASSRDASVTYTLEVNPADGRMFCSCPSRKPCKHERSVREGTAGKPVVRIRPLAARHLDRDTDDLFSDGGAALDRALAARS